MSAGEFAPIFNTFVADARKVLKVPGTKAESSLYGQLEALLLGSLEVVDSNREYSAAQQPNADNVGIPDYRIARGGELAGWVEFKAVAGKRLEDLKGHDKEQRSRFVDGLHNLILTNGWQWELYQDGKRIGPQVTIGGPEYFDAGTLELQVSEADVRPLRDLIEAFVSSELAPYRTAEVAVAALASRAKALKSALIEVGSDGAGEHLRGLEADFRGLLFKNGKRFTWAKFVDSYVQIATFGALLWRLESRKPIGLSAQVALKQGVHPLLAQCLEILWSSGSRLPILDPLLEALCTTVNLVEPELFDRDDADSAKGQYVPDAIVHAYEPFFKAYDSAAREANGVYYTPVEVVQQIVEGVDVLLRTGLGRAGGVLDRDARFLDPAMGTGTFILGLANQVARDAEVEGLPADQMVHEIIVRQTAGFEVFAGPYAIAHQRIEALLESMGTPAVERLPLFLTDTLSAPNRGPVGSSGFGIAGAEIINERKEADRLKTAEEILVVLGNPPYERVRKEAGGFEPFAKSLLDHVAAATPKEHRRDLKSATDLYVAFWTWALWALQPSALRSAAVEAPTIDPAASHGIVAFVTNRTWILGASLVGLRSLVCAGAKEVWVYDLGGDGRGSAGAKSFAGGDANVFGIQTGVAIVWIVFDRDYAGASTVYYRRAYGQKAAKLRKLRESFTAEDYEVVARPTTTDAFVPVNWQNAKLATAPCLSELFAGEALTGFQTARDQKVYTPLGLEKDDVLGVVRLSPNSPRRFVGRIGEWSELKNAAERETAWKTAQSQRRKNSSPPSVETLDPSLMRRVLYRPLDFRWLYDDPQWVDWYRKDLHELYDVCAVASLVTLAGGQGAGPTVMHVNALMEQHCFRGSIGGKAVFPSLRWGARGSTTPGAAYLKWDFSGKVIDWLSGLGRPNDYRLAYDYVLAILSAPAYSASEWKALEVDKLRVPLSKDAVLVDEAARCGSLLRAAWELRAPAIGGVKWQGKYSSEHLGDARHSAGTILFANGRTLVGVPPEAWAFEVSGYRVLPSWFAARAGWTVSAARAREALAVVNSAAVLARSAKELDRVFQSASR